MDYEMDFATEETGDITISACQAYLEEDDDNSDGCAYYLRIENNSDSRIQLLSKEFNITDDHGNSYYNNSLGFKGELPALEPGEYFEYSDSAPLKSAFGVLYGNCKIMDEGNSQVKNIRIPAINLIGSINKNCTLN